MPEPLIISGSFDPTGIKQGLDIAAAALDQFQAQVRSASSALPPIDVNQITQAANATRNLGDQTAKLAQHFEVGRQGGRRMETALAGMALAGQGVTGVTSKLIEGLVIFGAANIPLLEIAAAIAVLVTAYELLTKSQRDATDAREKLVKAFDKRIEGALPETTKISLEIAAIEEKRALILQNINQGLGLQLTSLKDYVGTSKAINEEKAKEAALGREVAAGEALIHKITLAAALADTLATLAVADKIRVAVQTATADAAKAIAALAALGPQTFGGQPGAVSIEEHTAFQARIAEARAATAGDLGQFQKQLVLAGQMAHATYDEVTAMHAKQEQLRLAIEFRKQEGAETVLQIKREEALLEATRERVLLIQAHLNRVLKAGGGNLLGQNPATVLPQLPPTAADFAAARQALLPLILQGAQQQGMVPGAGQAAWIQGGRGIPEAMSKVSQATQVLTTLGQTLEFLGQRGQAALQSIGGLADAISNLALNPGSFSSILGAVGATMGVVGTLSSALGPSPLDIEHLAILRANNDQLALLRSALQQSTIGAAGAGRQAEAVRFLAQNPNIVNTARGVGVAFPDAALKYLNDQLAQFGLTMADLNKWAKDNGIQLLDSQGKITAGSLDQLAQASALAIEQMTHFGKSIGDQTSLLGVHDNLFWKATDVSDVKALERSRKLILDNTSAQDAASKASGLPTGLPGAAAAGQLDLNTKAGQDAYRQWLQMIYKMGEAGQLTAAQLGKFASVTDLLTGPVNDAATALNALASASGKAISNMPVGFNLARYEFNASGAMKPLPPVGPPGSGGTSGGSGVPSGVEPSRFGFTLQDLHKAFWPNTPDHPLTAAELEKLLRQGGFKDVLPGQVVIKGDVAIHVNGANKSPAEIAAAVKKELTRVGMATTGSPDLKV